MQSPKGTLDGAWKGCYDPFSQRLGKCCLFLSLSPSAIRPAAAFSGSVKGDGHRSCFRAWICHAVRGWMLSVIMPHTKQARSRAIAVTATFFFFPWRIIR